MVNRAPSQASSRTATAYRTVAKSSEVDESLFGKNKPSGTKRGAQNVETLDKSASAQTQQRQPEVIALTRGELTRMMGPSPILTVTQAAELKRAREEKHARERATSNARKAHMLAMEAERKLHVPPTESELCKAAKDAETLSHADKLLREQQDEAKAMNQMMLYSKCVTIRDAQLQEKKHMMLEDEEEQRRLDLMMEMERVKALENLEERERQSKEERLKGAKILQAQLEERKKERIRQEELRERERVIMLKEMERLREEELRAQVEKQLKARQLIAEVAAANEEQIERKKQMQARELEEEARIAEYIRMRDLREQAIQEEKDRIAKEKELETQRMRAAQEKAADKQSEIDELRARRYAEAAEREWRLKESSKAARDKAILEELHKSRQAQKAAKVVQQGEMASIQKDEFERVLTVNRIKEEQDMKLAAQVEALRKQHQSELLAQIAANEEQRKLERQAHLEEGRKVRKEAKEYLLKVESIKQAKLKELQTAGVPEKYCAELAKYKAGVSGH